MSISNDTARTEIDSNGNMNHNRIFTANGLNTQTSTTTQIGLNMQRALLDLYYPVGTIYQTVVENSGPIRIGGTWERIQGRVLIGVGAYSDINNEIQIFENQTSYGEYKHKLTVQEMPTHSHGQRITANHIHNGACRADYDGDGSFNNYPQGINTEPSGGGLSHNNIQPSFAVFIYRRIE